MSTFVLADHAFSRASIPRLIVNSAPRSSIFVIIQRIKFMRGYKNIVKSEVLVFIDFDTRSASECCDPG